MRRTTIHRWLEALARGLLRLSRAEAENEERLRLALEGAEDGIWDWDVEADEVVFNERWFAMLGLPPGELRGGRAGWFERIHPEDAAGVAKALDAHLEGQIPVYQTEHRMRTAAGEWRWILARGKVVRRDAAGRPLRLSGVQKDITERKHAREALLRSEGLIRAILETAPDGVITINERGQIESFNEAAENIFGYSCTEILGKNVRLLMPLPEHDAHLARYLETGIPHILGGTRELTGCRRDSTTFPLELSVGEVRLQDRRIFTGVVRDVTARREAEEDLRIYRALVENTSEGVQLIRARDEITVYINPAFERTFGYAPSEIIGKPFGLLLPTDEQGRREFLRKLSDGLAQDGLWRGDVRARRKDGRLMWCRSRVSGFDHPKHDEVWVMVHEDVTDLVRAEDEHHRLIQELDRLRAGGSPEGGRAPYRSRSTTFPEVEAKPVEEEGTTPDRRPPAHRPPAHRPPAHRPLVLIAEDDPVAREMTAKLLEHGGFQVLTAHHGAEAVRRFEEHVDEIELVIVDLIMPVLGGVATCEKILRLRDDIPILLTSGYRTESWHRIPDGGEIPLIAKPFDYDRLLRKVRDMLR